MGDAQKVVDQINRDVGSRAIIKLSDPKAEEHVRVRTVPFGLLGLDMATGGCPLGRAIQLVGYPGCCKTGIAMKAAGALQRYLKRPVLVFDTEHSFEYDYARAMGLDTNEVYLGEPQSLEAIGDEIIPAIASNEFSAIIWDSVRAREPQRAMQTKKGKPKSMVSDADENMLPARTTNRICAKILWALGNKGDFDADPITTTVLLTNHMYETPDLFAGPQVPGGKGQRHMGSINIRLTRSSAIKIGPKGKEIEGGREIRWLTEKCKTAPDGRSGKMEFYTINHIGLIAPAFNTAHEVISYGVYRKLIIRNGRNYSYPSRAEKDFTLADEGDDGFEQHMGGSLAEAESYLINEPELMNAMYRRLVESCGWAGRINWP